MAVPLLKSIPSSMDWQVYAGDRNAEAFRITRNGDPIDLTDAEINAYCRVKRNDPQPAVIAVIAPIDLANGEFSVTWDGEELREALDAQSAIKWTGSWDLQVRMPGDDLPKTWLQGRFIIGYDVTWLSV
jgi:hypothetical protein